MYYLIFIVNCEYTMAKHHTVSKLANKQGSIYFNSFPMPRAYDSICFNSSSCSRPHGSICFNYFHVNLPRYCRRKSPSLRLSDQNDTRFNNRRIIQTYCGQHRHNLTTLSLEMIEDFLYYIIELLDLSSTRSSLTIQFWTLISKNTETIVCNSGIISCK